MITVRRFSPDDASAAAELEKLCFSRPWSEKELSASASYRYSVYFTAEYDGAFAGYAGAYTAADTAEINNIAVLPRFRRLGVGSALIDALVSECLSRGIKKLSLDVRASNTAAISLYEKKGFYRVGVRRGYYAAPREDAVLLDKDI